MHNTSLLVIHGNPPGVTFSFDLCQIKYMTLVAVDSWLVF
jgi:hypothetical protein